MMVVTRAVVGLTAVGGNLDWPIEAADSFQVKRLCCWLIIRRRQQILKTPRQKKIGRRPALVLHQVQALSFGHRC
jgi:hypothetical protein